MSITACPMGKNWNARRTALTITSRNGGRIVTYALARSSRDFHYARTLQEDEEMNNAETKAYLLEWIKHKDNAFNGPFAWPTDACGYNQHMRFVEHRNNNWRGGSRQDFDVFVKNYAEGLDVRGPRI